MAEVDVPTDSFLNDVGIAERGTPLPPPPPPLPDPNDPKYADDPDAYERDKQAAEAAAANFAAAAKLRGAAVGQVVSHWLATTPLDMLQELLDTPEDTMPIFKPVIGPAIVMRQEHVLECLARTDLFTVDPYAAEMARATDDKAKNPQAFSHFLLGTDNDELYRLDDVILRRVVSRADSDRLAVLARKEAERWIRDAKNEKAGEIDVVNTLAKFVPLRIVSDYLGVPSQNPGEPPTLPGLHCGDIFDLDADLLRVYTFSKIDKGVVPDAEQLFNWVKDIFRNTFNNFNQANPRFAEFRERGIVATEYLTAYVHALLKLYKERLRDGEVVPDTMLTRLLRLQREVSDGGGVDLEQDLAMLLGEPIPPGALEKRLSDSMIRSNVFGTVVGAVVNPQEGASRIVDSILRLKDNEYEVLNGSTYQEAVRAANLEEGDPGYVESLQTLRAYALEALRLKPQGEVLLRLCVRENTVLGGVLLRPGTPVFVGYAGAMRDPKAVVKPLGFDIARDEQFVGYLRDKERAREAPQSQLYLQHGYGRHKCLGRYASELTLRESLRALLRLGPLERLSQLEMDDQNLYAVSLRVGFDVAPPAEQNLL
jgi:cytochrome P450